MPSKKAKTLITLGFIFLGTLLGSIVSAAMLYPHYPEETFTLSEFLKNSLGAFIYSPLSMTFGVFPTIGFYTLPHAPSSSSASSSPSPESSPSPSQGKRFSPSSSFSDAPCGHTTTTSHSTRSCRCSSQPE